MTSKRRDLEETRRRLGDRLEEVQQHHPEYDEGVRGSVASKEQQSTWAIARRVVGYVGETMRTFREHVKVGDGGRIVLERPEISAGTEAEVIIRIADLPTEDGAAARPLASYLGAGKGCFSSAEEIDAFVREERDGWDS